MIKMIAYTPKITQAKTQYVDLDEGDMVWLQSRMICWLSTMGALDTSRNQDIRQVMKFWWYKRTQTLPKGKDGQNSPLSFTSGIINNLMWGTQRNLSIVQMDALESISAVMAQFEEAVSLLDITNEVPCSFKFHIKIFSFNEKT